MVPCCVTVTVLVLLDKELPTSTSNSELVEVASVKIEPRNNTNSGNNIDRVSINILEWCREGCREGGALLFFSFFLERFSFPSEDLIVGVPLIFVSTTAAFSETKLSGITVIGLVMEVYECFANEVCVCFIFITCVFIFNFFNELVEDFYSKF